MSLLVDTQAMTVTAFGRSVPCAIGRGGACPAEDKREGDGRTPLGRWALRTALIRPAVSLAEAPALPWRWIASEDGWSDDPADPAYNRPVMWPHTASAERMLRHDGLYDIVVTLAHNDAPPRPGAGSAIFLHCWRDAAPTEGCVAVERRVLADWLPRLRPGSVIEII